jgi:pilus assembly protein CpaB
MNKRFLYVLAFALVVSGGATLLFYGLIRGRMSAPEQPVTTQIIVAARNLEVGTLIRDTDLKTGPWPGTVPQSALVKKEDVLGRGVISTIYLDEPVIDSRLAPKGAGAGLAATIPPGMRAVAIRVNEVVGVAGFVLPGMRVDILISGTAPGSAPSLGTLSKTLLQNIQVLSAGQNIQKDTEGKPISVAVVNLLVTPDQAEILSLASNETKIQLVLRNPLDTQVTKTPGTAVAHLFTGQKLALAEAPAQAPRRAVVRQAPLPQPVKVIPAPLVVEVLHGSKRAESKFANAEVIQ